MGASRPTDVGVVIPAAGASLRMGFDKLLVKIGDRPVIAHTIGVFQDSPSVGEIVVVASESNLEPIKRLVADFAFTKVSIVCTGGARRQDSVWNGISSLSTRDWVVIHDGARPFVDETLIRTGLAEALPLGSAVAGVPVKETIKTADERGIVQSTLPRQNLWSVQTPQVFRCDIIVDAYRHVIQDVTDDAQLVELRGWPVKVYMGSYDNIKITSPEDLDLARLILTRRGEMPK